jgi:hypothetical protein
MPTHRAIKALLDNFLGTFSSRYSDHNGFWIFGLWVSEHDSLLIDLLSPQSSADSVSSSMANLAKSKFADQVTKAGFCPASFSMAQVSLARSADLVDGHAGNRPARGYRVTLTAQVVGASGREYSATCSFFAEPRAFAQA